MKKWVSTGTLITIIAYSFLTACGNVETSTASHINTLGTYTYSLSDPSKLPEPLLSTLKSNSKIPIYLPLVIPKFTPPLPSGYKMAAESEITPTGYDISLFWRPEGSSTNAYDTADYIGEITANQVSPVEQINSLLSPFKYETSIQLSNGTIAKDYKISRIKEANYQSEELITWKSGRWIYIADGWMNTMDSIYNTTALGMAETIAKSTQKQPVLKSVKGGYVEAFILGNRPLMQVCWTYNDKEWYRISTSDLKDTLNEATSTRLIHSLQN